MLGFFIQTLLVATGSTNVKDADRDGVNDALEQTLIEHFRPSFHVSVNDCAVLPAAFEAHSAEPRVSARDGTAYAPSSTEGALEIHYYLRRSKSVKAAPASSGSRRPRAPGRGQGPLSWDTAPRFFSRGQYCRR